MWVWFTYSVNCLKMDTHSYTYKRLKCTYSLPIDDNTISVCPISSKCSISIPCFHTHCYSLCSDVSEWRDTQCGNLYMWLCKWLCWSYLWKWVHRSMGCRSFSMIVVCQVPYKRSEELHLKTSLIRVDCFFVSALQQPVFSITDRTLAFTYTSRSV